MLFLQRKSHRENSQVIRARLDHEFVHKRRPGMLYPWLTILSLLLRDTAFYLKLGKFKNCKPRKQMWTKDPHFKLNKSYPALL
jgi:hypothetical protein